MRKSRLSPISNSSVAPGRDGLDLEQVARVEVSSEAEGYPVEGALLKDVQGGWRASEPGIQTIRLLFDHPQTIRVIQLVFKEKEFGGLKSSCIDGCRSGQASGKMSYGSSGTSVHRSPRTNAKNTT